MIVHTRFSSQDQAIFTCLGTLCVSVQKYRFCLHTLDGFDRHYLPGHFEPMCGPETPLQRIVQGKWYNSYLFISCFTRKKGELLFELIGSEFRVLPKCHIYIYELEGEQSGSLR